MSRRELGGVVVRVFRNSFVVNRARARVKTTPVTSTTVDRLIVPSYGLGTMYRTDVILNDVFSAFSFTSRYRSILAFPRRDENTRRGAQFRSVRGGATGNDQTVSKEKPSTGDVGLATPETILGEYVV